MATLKRIARTGRSVPGRDSPARPFIDLRGVTDHPITGAYLAGGAPYLIEVPVRACRAPGATAFSCAPDARNPFVETVAAYSAGRCASYAESPLRTFYVSWHPATLAEALGISTECAHPELHVEPTFTPPLPWEHKHAGPSSSARSARPGFRAQRLPGGGDVGGIIFHGPVTEDFGDITFRRITALYDAIRDGGYAPEAHRSTHMRAYILAAHGEFRVILRGGKHRISALAALGWNRVPVQIGGSTGTIVYRDDAAFWPNVIAGLFDRDSALAIFDRMFAGRPPAGCVWPDG